MFDLCVGQTGKLVDGSMPNLYTMPLLPSTHLPQAGSDAAAGSSSAQKATAPPVQGSSTVVGNQVRNLETMALHCKYVYSQRQDTRESALTFAA